MAILIFFPIAEAKAQNVYSLGTALPFSIRLMFDCLIPLFSELRVFHIFFEAITKQFLYNFKIRKTV